MNNKSEKVSSSFIPHLSSLHVAIDARYVQDHFPGIGRYTFHLVEALAALPNGPSLTLLHNPALPDRRYNLPQLAERYPERVRLLDTSARPFSFAEQWRLFGPARQSGAALWHAPYYIRPYLLPLPSILTAYDVSSTRLPAMLPSLKAKLAFEATTRLAFWSSRHLIAISQATANDIQELYKVPAHKISVIPLGVSPHFKPLTPPEQADARALLGLPPRYLLYLGINKPHKNLARLLEAFKLYREQGGDPEIKLMLAGKEDPRYSADLRKSAEHLNLTSHVLFWGEVSEADLPALYACADLFVFPSQQEGFGLPVLEAMASGTAVACANNSSLPEVAGEAALLFPADNVKLMADAIGEGLQKQAELREKGLSRARLFSWQRVAELTAEVYTKV